MDPQTQVGAVFQLGQPKLSAFSLNSFASTGLDLPEYCLVMKDSLCSVPSIIHKIGQNCSDVLLNKGTPFTFSCIFANKWFHRAETPPRFFDI